MAQFTERAIIETFVRLLDQMPLEKITVKEIVEECGISRNTFYYHFGDIYALLEALFRRDVQRICEEQREGDTWADGLHRAVTFLSDNRRAVYHIYESLNHGQLEQYLYRATDQLIMACVDKAAEGLPVKADDLRFVGHAYQAMFVGLLLEWLQQGMRGDPVDVLGRAQRLFFGSMRSVLENSLPVEKTEKNGNKICAFQG